MLVYALPLNHLRLLGVQPRHSTVDRGESKFASIFSPGRRPRHTDEGRDQSDYDASERGPIRLEAQDVAALRFGSNMIGGGMGSVTFSSGQCFQYPSYNRHPLSKDWLGGIRDGKVPEASGQ